MLPFNLQVFWDEDDAEKLLRGVVAIVAVFPSAYSRNLGHENLCIC